MNMISNVSAGWLAMEARDRRDAEDAHRVLQEVVENTFRRICEDGIGAHQHPKVSLDLAEMAQSILDQSEASEPKTYIERKVSHHA